MEAFGVSLKTAGAELSEPRSARYLYMNTAKYICNDFVFNFRKFL